MKITIESTSELAHANGLPVRVWTGATERGTPILALITRVATLEGADASELEAELSEPPTRVIDPSGEVVASPRSCTVCNFKGQLGRPATHVARDAEGLEWFECGEHDPTDNPAETVRVALEPIADWFDRHEVPLPGGVYRGPASGREPWASMLARAPSDELVRRARSKFSRNDGRLLRAIAHGWLAVDELTLVGPAGVALQVLQALDALAIVHEAEAEATDLDETMLKVHGHERHLPPELERRGAPDRLSPAERFALDALHRWLHSPGGDCELIDSAQPYHDQVEAESPTDCQRLEAEETAAYAAVPDVAVVPGQRDPFVEPEAPLSSAYVAIAAELGQRHTDPPLPRSLMLALLDHPRVSGADVDKQVGGAFLAQAYLGARLGWHVRQSHPETTAATGRQGAPVDEPDRSAWLTGYRLAAGGENAEAETPPAPVVDAIAELRARGLDLAAMNHARFSSGLPTISAEQALARLDAARVVNAAVRGAVAAQPACRVCKCTDDDCSQCIAKTGSPCRWVEPDLCSACASEPPNHPNTPENEPAAPIRFTYVDGIDAARDERLRADGFEPVQSSPEAIELTDELREYAREQLHYLAPELQSARDRAILAAYDAEETARTTSPDTWLGGER